LDAIREDIMYINKQRIVPPVSPLRNVIALAVVLVVGCFVNASAQWTTPDASQNINNTNTGNVGIGTTTPGSLLEVKKNQSSGTTVTVDNPFTTVSNSAYSGLVLKQNGVLRLQFVSVNDNNSVHIGGPGAAQIWNLANGPMLFATNSLERMRINAAGKIGINSTIVPTAQLHIATVSGEGEALRFYRPGNSVGWGVAQFFALNNSSGGMVDYAQISGGISSNSAGGESGVMAFYTRNGGTLAERVRIAANGDMGLGTITPGAKLHVVGSVYSSAAIEAFYNQGFRLVVTGPGDSRASWTYDGGTTTTRLTSVANVKTSLGSNNVNDRLVLDLSGNVGVGTATPGYRLDVQGGSINTSQNLCINGDCKSSWSQVGGQWANGTGSINYAGGSVGIGITSPIYSLDVNGGVNGFRAKAASAAAGDTIATFENNSAIKMIVRANGNVGIGTTSPAKTLDVNGDINAAGTITGGTIQAKYQDVAEWVESSQELPAGTVVVLDQDKNNQVVASTQSYDSRVAGVISPQPGITLGERGEGRVLVAATGRVRVKVDAGNGPIKIGDLLVTSDKEGFAMKSIPVEVGGVRMHRPGTLIGKALEPLAQGSGEILVLLSLQ
jgi:Peptidase_G2, IMC autoproteolytic cleavage domain